MSRAAPLARESQTAAQKRDQSQAESFSSSADGLSALAVGDSGPEEVKIESGERESMATDSDRL